MKVGQDKSRQVRTGQDRLGKVRTGQGRSTQIRGGREKSRQDKTSHDFSGNVDEVLSPPQHQESSLKN